MRLAYREAGEGSPVVLLHGLFGSARNLGGVARALAAGGHHVVSMDLRNHGESGHDPAVDYATLAADVAETMHAAGLAQAAVVGHSMGGKVAMRLALTDPARVSRLVGGGHRAGRLPVPLRRLCAGDAGDRPGDDAGRG